MVFIFVKKAWFWGTSQCGICSKLYPSVDTFFVYQLMYWHYILTIQLKFLKKCTIEDIFWCEKSFFRPNTRLRILSSFMQNLVDPACRMWEGVEGEREMGRVNRRNRGFLSLIHRHRRHLCDVTCWKLVPHWFISI